ncbi:hypothetical protein JCM10908_000387 [Rhodotorula pacifica]|uniref:uncharacterized protein n=1 Tax=Rhodotorula pacifica TaxID=1495444 RepID=UPI00317D2B59
MAPPTTPACRACLASLPNDLLHRVLANIYGARWPYSASSDVGTLLSAMQTCQALAHVGREIPYLSPTIHRHTIPIAWSPYHEPAQQSALRLLETLQNNSKIAAMVQDLSHLLYIAQSFQIDYDGSRGTYVARHHEKFAPESYETSAEGYRIQEELLRACTRTRRVTVELYSLAQAERVGHLLNLLPRLTVLELHTRNYPDHADLDVDRPDAPLYSVCLQGLTTETADGTPRLDKLDLNATAHFCDGEDCALSNTLRGITRAFRLDIRRCRYLQLGCYLPWRVSPAAEAASAGITTLLLYIDTVFDRFDDPEMLRHALNGNCLETFVIEDDGRWEPFDAEDTAYPDLRHINTYTRDLNDLVYPKVLFELFPCARKICLREGHDMTLERLELLADSSPFLEYIDMRGTYWSIARADLTVGPGRSLSPFERRLVLILERLENLKQIHLGVWPYITAKNNSDVRHGRSGLDEWARGRNITLLLTGSCGEVDTAAEDSDSE